MNINSLQSIVAKYFMPRTYDGLHIEGLVDLNILVKNIDTSYHYDTVAEMLDVVGLLDVEVHENINNVLLPVITQHVSNVVCIVNVGTDLFSNTTWGGFKRK